jgi:hypothetical protein
MDAFIGVYRGNQKLSYWVFDSRIRFLWKRRNFLILWDTLRNQKSQNGAQKNAITAKNYFF